MVQACRLCLVSRRKIKQQQDINMLPVLAALPAIITALTPVIPLIVKANDAKKSNKSIIDTIKGSNGLTELAQGGYMLTLVAIYKTVESCSETLTLASLSCVSQDQWAYLLTFAAMAYARLREKAKAKL